MTRTCWLISSPRNGFLIGAEAGTPVWSCSAHEAVVAHHAWLDQAVATHKLREAERVWPRTHFDLVVLKFESHDGQWHPTSQGVHPCDGG